MRIVIVKAITWVAVLVLAVGVCAIDSDSMIPFIACLISLVWLGLVAWANEWIC